MKPEALSLNTARATLKPSLSLAIPDIDDSSSAYQSTNEMHIEVQDHFRINPHERDKLKIQTSQSKLLKVTGSFTKTKKEKKNEPPQLQSLGEVLAQTTKMLEQYCKLTSELRLKSES